MKKVRIIYNRENFFYEDKSSIGLEFFVHKNPAYPGMWLLFPGVGYVLAPGLWILETDCEEI